MHKIQAEHGAQPGLKEIWKRALDAQEARRQEQAATRRKLMTRAAAGLVSIAVLILAGLARTEGRFRLEKIHALFVAHAELRQACQEELGYWIAAWDDDAILDVAFGPDGQLLATLTNGGEVQQWRTADGWLLDEARAYVGSQSGEHTDYVGTVAFSPTGISLANERCAPFVPFALFAQFVVQPFFLPHDSSR